MKLSSTARTTLLMGSCILLISLGLRHGFGLFLQPISEANGWGREVFAFAIAMQNLFWGVAQPLAGMLADKLGAKKIMLAGATLYLLGLFLMSWAPDPVTFTLSAGVLIGIGLAGTTMPVVFGAISRALPPEKRSMAFGVAMSLGSIGQFAMMPGVLSLIGGVGWASTLIIMSAVAALMLPLALFVREPANASGVQGPSAGQAARLALRTPGFWLLSAGFFVCGFHVVFISTHLPSYVADEGLPESVGSTALALIGLFNILGSLAAGWLGSRFSKPLLLAWIYGMRGIAFVLFLWLPVTPLSVLVFASVMGVLWLSTVPLTNGVIAVMFDVKNLAMLSGFAFVLHQLGSFLGGWLGGLLYDYTDSYALIWGVAMVLSFGAAAVNLFVKERPVRPANMTDNR